MNNLGFWLKGGKKMEDYTVNHMMGIFLLGIVLGGILGFCFFSDLGANKIKKELGKSICEEEYEMDFESYDDKVLRCKPFTENYDGIQVEIPKAQLKN